LSDILPGPALRRRGLLGLGATALLGLPGCGFTPMHARPAGGTAISAEMGAIEVARIPERFGQLQRRALQERLWSGGQSSPRYTLTVLTVFGVEPEGFRNDGLPTRIRYTATTNWQLTTNEVPPRPVTNGTERTLDAYNLPDNQFFAADASRDALFARLVEQSSEDVVTRLAAFFQRQAAAG
jgi:LPS-assembly lipoprotein